MPVAAQILLVSIIALVALGISLEYRSFSVRLSKPQKAPKQGKEPKAFVIP